MRNKSRHFCILGHCGVGLKGVVLDGTTLHLTFTVETQSNDLTYHQPYKVRQVCIHKLISHMHDAEGFGYRVIAKKLNSWRIQTERGTMWNSPKVNSVLKRQRQRDQRISELREKTYSLQIKDIQLEYSPL
jgi:hypothetical protein